jgi:hypothetical protein
VVSPEVLGLSVGDDELQGERDPSEFEAGAHARISRKYRAGSNRELARGRPGPGPVGSRSLPTTPWRVSVHANRAGEPAPVFPRQDPMPGFGGSSYLPDPWNSSYRDRFQVVGPAEPPIAADRRKPDWSQRGWRRYY